jgi:hypothetical protein
MKDLLVLEGREYMSLRAVAKRLGFDRKTVKNWSECGVLPSPAIVVAQHRFYDMVLIERWLLTSTDL